ncbi:YjfB family protein [Paenibacillus radicis (ex Xue et al. 2023)]|uniref:YjfB family protein n=1 Tax=Paenibacillus radicis (ex Xue et al. 2023) TaxID=2972489 RepID=A0ABT1YH06_9BACL|nr:YjfB family protein [Paenibacillus radicis (ex Xue et al. 2023)]MCR8632485.1 YjfB family protein [Paenibacillus radicis (ex Xue et al. 2023)]
MEINSTLAAVSSGDALQQAVGITLLNKVQDTQAAQAAVMLQDFAAAQHPHLGKSLDIKI